jgi:hypothetical protein
LTELVPVVSQSSPEPVLRARWQRGVAATLPEGGACRLDQLPLQSRLDCESDS